MTRKRVEDIPEEVLEESDFIIPASDSKGHSARQWYRCHPGVDRQMSVIIASKKFPYRTKGDLMRHAVMRHVAWLHHQNPVEGSTFADLDFIIETGKEIEMETRIQERLRDIEDIVKRLVDGGQIPAARRVIATAVMKIEGMAEGFRREEIMEAVVGKWGHLLRGDKGAKLFTKP